MARAANLFNLPASLHARFAGLAQAVPVFGRSSAGRKWQNSSALSDQSAGYALYGIRLAIA
jgi:hypothetical protein